MLASLAIGLAVMAVPPSARAEAGGAAATFRPMQWSDLTRRPLPKATRRFSYGRAKSQFVELWQPNGLGPHPTVIMIHGGCWDAKVANLNIMAYIAADLQRRGIAVWNIEYRRVGDPGGGYPGTFQDVARAVDLIRTYGPPYGLDLGRVVAVGHSAGGQLALWAAGRPRLPKTSILHSPDPLPIHAVVDIAGIPDLQHDTHTACGAEVIRALVGQPTAARPDVYADTSPIRLLPLGVPQVVIHGAEDTTVPPAVGLAYARAARAAGDRVTFLTPEGGHVEEITPGTAAWAVEAAQIRALAGPNPPPGGGG